MLRLLLGVFVHVRHHRWLSLSILALDSGRAHPSAWGRLLERRRRPMPSWRGVFRLMCTSSLSWHGS
eukprot:s397_g58.t1